MPSNLKYIIAEISGIPNFVNWLNRKRPLVLAYHGIYDGPKRIGDLPPTFVNSRDMTDQLIYIKKRYRILTPEEFLISLEKDSGFPPNPALITFDDAYESFCEIVAPIVRSLGIHPIVFVPTHYVQEHKPFWFDVVWYFVKHSPDEKKAWLLNLLGIMKNECAKDEIPDTCLREMKKMLPWDRDNIVGDIIRIASREFPDFNAIKELSLPMTPEQLKEITSLGVTLGCHTHTHTIMSVLSKAQAEYEVVENKRCLESITGKRSHFFAYPNGGPGDYTDENKSLLRNVGFRVAFSLTQKRSSLKSDLMDVSRIHVAPEDTAESLMFRCKGMAPLVEKIRGLFFNTSNN